METETGLHLLNRLRKQERPNLGLLTDPCFPLGFKPGDVTLVHGESSVGKTHFLLNLIRKIILPKSAGGLESYAVLIDTDHHISISRLLEIFCYGVPEPKEKNAGFERLLVLKTYTSEQLKLNLFNLDILLAKNPKICAVFVDSLTAYYWQDSGKIRPELSMLNYLKKLLEQFGQLALKHEIAVFATKQASFKWEIQPILPDSLSYSVKLFPNDSSNAAEIMRRDGSASYEDFIITNNGLVWQD